MNEFELVLPTSWEPNRDEFLASLGVSTQGLGEFFFGQVYDALFVKSIDVKEEYTKYYSVEYSSLEEYLNIRYGISLNQDDLDAEKIFCVPRVPEIIDERFEKSELDTVLECIKKLEEVQNEG